jgi:hypothetical protein
MEKMCSALDIEGLRSRIEQALRIYNKYRNPEVEASLIRIAEDGASFIMSFTGSFCKTCGLYDYFEDLIYEMQDESRIETKIINLKEDWETDKFIVTYGIANAMPTR